MFSSKLEVDEILLWIYKEWVNGDRIGALGLVCGYTNETMLMLN